MKKRSPKPNRIITYDALYEVWKDSKDNDASKKKASGIDNITPETYRSNLIENLTSLCRKLTNGTYRFNKLKPHFIDKKNGKKRVICVPTVEDRLVQRLLLRHLTWDAKTEKNRDLLKVDTNVSYGVKKGKDQGVSAAINAAIRDRNNHPWVLKTDVQSFFDKIPRDYLKQQIRTRLKNSSIVPLLEAVVDCEVTTNNNDERAALKTSGIETGRGLRQGMPLSPLLSNLVLNKFDRSIRRRGYKLHRYADDIICCCDSREECERVEGFIQKELEKVRLSIPSLNAEDSKTQIIAPEDPVEFLGIEIYRAPNGSYQQRMPRETIERAIEKIGEFSSVEKCNNENLTYNGVSKKLDEIIQGYKASFAQCANFTAFENRMRTKISEVKRTLLESTLGAKVYNGLGSNAKKFLGIEDI